MAISGFLEKINKNNYLDEDDFNELKKINEMNLLSIFQDIGDGVDGSIYLLKCYMTVMDKEVFDLAYEDNKSMVEFGLSRLWKDEIRFSKREEVIDAYIPINLFSSKIISYFRSGISKHSNKDLFEFDVFIHELIIHLTEKRDFVVSKIMFNSYDYTNNDVLKDIESQDKELAIKLLTVYDNLMLASTLISFSYINNVDESKRLKKIIKKEINESYAHTDMDVVGGFFSYDLFDYLNGEFSLKRNNRFKDIATMFRGVSKTGNHLDSKRESSVDEIDSTINELGLNTNREPEPDVSTMSFNSINNEKVQELDSFTATNNDDDLNEMIAKKDKSSFFNPKKQNRFNEGYYKKDSGLKLIVISIFIIMASAFTVFMIISSEIERENKILETDLVDSEIPISVNVKG